MKKSSKMHNTQYYLKEYLKERPLFLSLTRSCESPLYQKYLPLQKPVLDLGCGDGFFAKVTFAQQIDIGLDMVDSRLKENKYNSYKKIVTYDGKRIPYPDNYFATVVSNCVLEHIPDIDQTLSEIYRVLKKGGLFLTTVMSAPWEEYLFGNIFLGDIYKKWMRKKQEHHTILKERQWKNKFKKHTFRIIDESGYIDKTAARWIDCLHYACIPNLVTYILMRRWVLWPMFNSFIPTEYFANLLDKQVSSTESACIFFVLRK